LVTVASEPKKPQQSPLLELVQRLERAIGEPIEAFVRSDSYFDLTTQAKRAQSLATRAFEGLWEEWLHLFNVPAATDVRRLKEQLGRVERQLNQIAKELADREEAEQGSRRSAGTSARRGTGASSRGKRTAPASGKPRSAAEPEADGT
jgi:hypothetical protein